jgi:dipeptidyl aminopeptidase/acylaminoacyl peptidase
MTLFLALILLAMLFLVGAALVILVVGPLILLQPERRTREWYAKRTTLLEPKDAGLPQEHLLIRTRDGLKLDAWFVPRRQQARGTILYLHGVGDCKIDGVALARLLFNHGFNVLLYDSRRHGESEGSYCTYGYYEKHDVSTVIDMLTARRDVHRGKVGIFGTSMGAAVAIQAAAIDPRICAVVAEASFTDLRTISVDYQRRIVKLPWHFLRNVAMSRSQEIANFKARDVSPIEDVRKLKTPLLFIHGTEDKFIKVEYSKLLFEAAAEPKELLLIEGANHNDLWQVGGMVYERKVVDFFERHLS